MDRGEASATRRARCGERARWRPAERELRSLATVLRGTCRATPARPRLRGSALGGRRSPRFRRRPPGLGRRRASTRALHGAPGAPRPSPRLGRWKAERADDLALAARRRRDSAADRRAARPSRPARGDADGAPGSRRRKSPVRGAVRPDDLRAHRRRGGAARDGARDHRGSSGLVVLQGEGVAAGRRRARQGVLAERTRGDRRCRRIAGRGQTSWPGPKGIRPARAAWIDRGRDRVRVRASLGPRRRLQPDPARGPRRKAPPCRDVDRLACARSIRRSCRDAGPPLRVGTRVRGRRRAGNRHACPAGATRLPRGCRSRLRTRFVPAGEQALLRGPRALAGRRSRTAAASARPRARDLRLELGCRHRRADGDARQIGCVRSTRRGC